MSRDHRRSVSGKPTNVKGKKQLTVGEKQLLTKTRPPKAIDPDKEKVELEQDRLDALNARDVYSQMIKQQKALMKEDPSRRKELKALIEDYQDKIDDIDAKLGIPNLPAISKTKDIGSERPKITKPFQHTKGPKNEEIEQAEATARSLIIPSERINSRGMGSITGHNGAKLAARTQIMAPQIAPQFWNETKKPTRTFLFMGPPGTGKTQLAKAIAKDSGMNFMEVRTSDLLSKFVGTPNIRIKALFHEAAKKQPLIMFIDEADDLFDREDEHIKKIANEFNKSIADLQVSNEMIYVIAATNKPEKLDGAAIRRFTPVRIDLPSPAERTAMFETRSKTEIVKLDNIDYNELGELTEGYSGSDIHEISAAALSKPLNEIIEQLGANDLHQLKDIPTSELRAVTMADYLESIDDRPKSVSAEDLIAIEEFWSKTE